jgi:iron-sulfur cluster assembly protein
MIQLSPAAAAEIGRLKSCQAQPTDLFRLSVSSTGCAGLSYVMQFEAVAQAQDQVYDCHGIPVMIDPESHGYLDGLTLDYSEDLMGGGFRFHNPKAKKSCDCGMSFSITDLPIASEV